MLKLEGKLAGPWVDELEKTWSSVREAGEQPLFVDLDDLTSMDEAGEALLRKMHAAGTVFLAETPFIRQALRRITAESRGSDG